MEFRFSRIISQRSITRIQRSSALEDTATYCVPPGKGSHLCIGAFLVYKFPFFYIAPCYRKLAFKHGIARQPLQAILENMHGFAISTQTNKGITHGNNGIQVVGMDAQFCFTGLDCHVPGRRQAGTGIGIQGKRHTQMQHRQYKSQITGSLTARRSDECGSFNHFTYL